MTQSPALTVATPTAPAESAKNTNRPSAGKRPQPNGENPQVVTWRQDNMLRYALSQFDDLGSSEPRCDLSRLGAPFGAQSDPVERRDYLAEAINEIAYGIAERVRDLVSQVDATQVDGELLGQAKALDVERTLDGIICGNFILRRFSAEVERLRCRAEGNVQNGAQAIQTLLIVPLTLTSTMEDVKAIEQAVADWSEYILAYAAYGLPSKGSRGRPVLTALDQPGRGRRKGSKPKR